MSWGENQDNSDRKTMEVSFFNSIDMLPQHCSDLFLAGEKDSYDLSADWYRLFESEAISPGTKPLYCVLLKNNEIKGVLPLISKRSLLGQQTVSMANFYSSIYRPLLTSSLSTEELAFCLRKILQIYSSDLLRLDAMDPTHPSFEFLEAACKKAGLKSYRFFGFGNWYLPVQGRSFEDYLKDLPSQIRNTVRRREKKFLDNGRGEYKLITGGSKLEHAIDSWKKIYNASWKKPEPFPNFVPGLIRICAAQGWLRLGIAYYEGEPVAAQFWIVNNGRAIIYKLAYDEKYAKLSAGTLLTAYLMAHVIDMDKVEEVDYMIGDDAYKKYWMTNRRERWGIVAYNLKTAGGLILAAVQSLGIHTQRLRKKLGLIEHKNSQ